jgi:hypothetical protein
MPQPNRVFSITELRRTGADTLEPTPVTFRWDAETRTMPVGDIEEKLEIKTNRREYPGSDEPVEQVLSATWQPFDIEGEWQDRHAGQGYALATYRDFARLCMRAPLVRVQCEEWSIVGLITAFEPRRVWAKRYAWKITISPHRNETVGSARAAGRILHPTGAPPRESVAAARESVDAITASTAAAGTLPLADPPDFPDISPARFAAAVSFVSGNVTRLESIAARGLETDATGTLISMAANFRSLRDSQMTAAAGLGPARSGLQAGFDDPIVWLKLDAWSRGSQADARAAALRAHEAEADARNAATARPLAVYTPAAGESPYRISTKFYGVPGEWRRIWDFNKLDTLVLTGEERLVIPRRTAT